MSHARVLDYGCGMFDFGVGIAPHVAQVDGFDIDKKIVVEAALRSRHLPNGQVIARIEDIPRQYYHIIIANGVVQYLPNVDSLNSLYHTLRTFLRPEPSSALLFSDVVQKPFCFPLEVRDLLRHCKEHRLLSEALVHMVAQSVPWICGNYLEISQAEIDSLVRMWGCTLEHIYSNLTPSTQRHSFLLRQLNLGAA